VNYKVFLAALLIASVTRADILDPVPRGWVLLNPPSAPVETFDPAFECEMGIDGAMAQAGQPNLSIICGNAVGPVAGLSQVFEAVAFYGKRVRFSAWLKAGGIEGVPLENAPERNLPGRGGLVMVVPSSAGPLTGGISMTEIAGWTDWEYREFVVDIPNHGAWIVVGFGMIGKGQLWMRDLEFEVVPTTVPVNLSLEIRQSQLEESLRLQAGSGVTP
jgi:hypothetical protein